ncbi:BTAD domain-containing putative transcriptional regulator, partial [Streptomyces calidiresistens]
AAEAGDASKYYRIQPPEGRHHDTLWGIAERHLGDGLRYKEIYELNRDRVQPDGSRLTEASLIRPGWILEMPADATGGELVEAPGEDLDDMSPDEADEFLDYRETGDTGGDAAGGGTPGGAEETPQPPAVPDPAADHSDWTGPGAGGPGGTEETEHAVVPAEREAEAAGESGRGAIDALMAAPLLAAGLLIALGRARRQALWQAAAGALGRGVGDDLEPETPAAGDARDALLAGADPGAVAFLDRALRTLSAALDAEGRTLPAVYAAWLGADELHLQLAHPAGDPPAPWQPGQSDTYWTLERARLAGTPGGDAAGDAGAAAEAPYPGLVSLGTRDGIRLLLNLEAVPGIVSVLGAPRDREAVLGSVAAELATSGWSDRMTVTLVGFGAEMTALAPTRVRHLEDIAGLLEVMETETNLRHANLRHTGQDSILTGRTGPSRRHHWAPHLVVVGVEPTEDEAERLGALASVSAPLGIGYLVTSDRPDLPGLAWEFEVTPEGLLKEPDMGLELTAQLLPAAGRAAVVELFAGLAAGEGGSDGTGGGAGEPSGPVFTVDLSARGKPEVYAEIMGGYTVTGLPEPEPERAAQLREALALLLLHRAGVHPRVMAAALWPRGVSDDVRDAFLARLGDWLGRDAEGAPRLTTGDDGRLALSARVVSDWDVLRTLHHHAGRPGAADRARRLTDALALARGPLLDGQRAEGGYAWLDHEIVDAQYPLLVAGIALGLAEEHLGAGKGEQAYLAVRSALAAAPTDERLWNELLRAAHATGNREWLEGAADWLTAHHAQLFGPDQPLPARTRALMDEFLPGRRVEDNAVS